MVSGLHSGSGNPGSSLGALWVIALGSLARHFILATPFFAQVFMYTAVCCGSILTLVQILFSFVLNFLSYILLYPQTKENNI